jgi:hypothetical protein
MYFSLSHRAVVLTDNGEGGKNGRAKIEVRKIWGERR